ncbi:hypothetical protein [Acrocarpospora corrugata]|nr:hypothetical protein [Acrocarpospora corrugata]
MTTPHLTKVPRLTLYFWVIKVLCTTVGETAADFLDVHLDLGLTNTTYLMTALLLAALVIQFSARRYVPGSTGSSSCWSAWSGP